VTPKIPVFPFRGETGLPFPKIMPGRSLKTTPSSLFPPFPPGLFYLKNLEKK